MPLTNFALQPGGNDHALLLFLTAGPCVYEFTVRAAAAVPLHLMLRCGRQRRSGTTRLLARGARPTPPFASAPPPKPQLTEATGTILGVQPVQYISWYSAAARTALSPALLLATAGAAAALARWLA